MRWDGDGTFPPSHDGVDGTAGRFQLRTSHRYAEPGTHPAPVRVTSHREGDVAARVRRCDNPAQVRALVT